MIEERTIRKQFDIYTTDREKKSAVKSTKAQKKKKKIQPRITKDQTLVEVDGIKEVLDYLCNLRAVNKQEKHLESVQIV